MLQDKLPLSATQVIVGLWLPGDQSLAVNPNDTGVAQRSMRGPGGKKVEPGAQGCHLRWATLISLEITALS